MVSLTHERNDNASRILQHLELRRGPSVRVLPPAHATRRGRWSWQESGRLATLTQGDEAVTRVMTVAIAAIIIAAIAAYVTMQALHVDGAQLIAFIIPSMIGLYASALTGVVNKKLNDQKETIAQVANQTDENMSKLIDAKTIVETATMVHDSGKDTENEGRHNR